MLSWRHGLGWSAAARIADLKGLRRGWCAMTGENLLTLSEIPAEPQPFDPVDRLLVAQAGHEPMILVSSDPAMKRYGATVFPLPR